MDIDVTRHLGATEREVETRDRDGRPTRVVIARRTYDTTVEDLWEALTSEARLPRWFLPVTGDLREGGQYRIHGNASGEILRCEPPRHLSITWEYGGDVSWVEVRLAEAEQGARLVLEHAAHIDDERWGRYGPGAVGVGWDLSLVGLALHIATGEPNDPQAFEAWSGSDEGRAFIGVSSEGWGRASAAAGTSPAEATTAAARTTAFYTGEPEPG